MTAPERCEAAGHNGGAGPRERSEPMRGGVVTAGEQWRATRALARFEATRLLRHPVSIVAAVLFLAPWLYGWVAGSANRFPVLQVEDQTIQLGALFLLGGAALIVANLTVLRSHRHRTAGQEDVLVLPDAWRTGGLLLALLPFALGVAALVALRIGVSAALPGAAGRPNAFELAVGPAAAVLLGAVGVLLGRLGRATIMAPLLLLGIGAVTVSAALPGIPLMYRLRWLLPVALDGDPLPLPVELIGRPAGRHLGYLLAVIVVVAGVALLCSGARGRRAVGVIAAALVVAVALGAAQFLPPAGALTRARIAATDRPADQQTCERIDQVTYCAFPDFLPWVGEWDAVVRGVLRRVPAAEARKPIAVRQRVLTYGLSDAATTVVSGDEQEARARAWRQADAAAGTPNAVTIGLTWGDAWSEVGLAGMVAYEVLAREGAGVNGVVCGARGVLLAWLAGQATTRVTAALHLVDADSQNAVQFGDRGFLSGVSVSDREMAVAFALLARPADDVAKIVLAAWGELSAVDTPTERAGQLFGVPVGPEPPVGERTTCLA